MLYCLRSKQTRNIDINVALFLPPVDGGLILIVAGRTCFTQGRMYPGRSVLPENIHPGCPFEEHAAPCAARMFNVLENSTRHVSLVRKGCLSNVLRSPR